MCLESLLKCVINIINYGFFVLGGCMLGMGIWLLVDDTAVTWLNNLGIGVSSNGGEDPLWKATCIAVIALGAFLLVLGFCGCCGVSKQSSFLLNIYIILVFVCLCLELGVLIMAVVFNTSVVFDTITESMQKNLQDEYGVIGGETGNDATTLTWNTMQFDLKCCGAMNYTDYEGSKFSESSNPYKVPYSCCVMKEGTESPGTPEDVVDRDRCSAEANMDPDDPNSEYQNLHGQGCSKSMTDKMKAQSSIVIGVCCGIVLVQILGLVVACKSKKEKGADIA